MEYTTTNHWIVFPVSVEIHNQLFLTLIDIDFVNSAIYRDIDFLTC